jgi:membrane protease YdiL (CAAX protease family)
LGGFFVGAEAYRRFMRRVGLNVLDYYALVMAVAITLGIVAGFDVGGLPRSRGVVVGLAVGVTVGLVARHLDRYLSRWYARRTTARGRRHSEDYLSSTRPSPSPRVVPSGGALLLGGSGSPSPRQAMGTLPVRAEFAMATVVCVAALEELFYRGLLLNACLDLGGWVGWSLVAVSTLFFILTHVAFGWGQVIAKTPLGLLTTLAAITTGVIAPVTAHVLFNLSVRRDMIRDERSRSR